MIDSNTSVFGFAACMRAGPASESMLLLHVVLFYATHAHAFYCLRGTRWESPEESGREEQLLNFNCTSSASYCVTGNATYVKGSDKP